MMSDVSLRTRIYREDSLYLFPRRWTWWVQRPAYNERGMIGWDPVGRWGRCFTRWGAERRAHREMNRVANERKDGRIDELRPEVR